ncbi:MAG: histidine--tRNA ligase [Bacilli bacterium]
MKKVTPKIMPGFMELLPEDQILFNEMVDTIRNTYESFGFLPLDTPVLEYSDVLLAKAGGETEKQIYRFKKGENDISLRFDLTVPLARYASQRYNDLVFPFKRYQIGKVYRGERPQKGRFREFYQCDIDVIGENLDIVYDAEIPTIIYNIFKKLDFGKFTIRINNRKLLNGFFESLNLQTKASDVLRIIDKLEKIGIEEVIKELKELSVNEDQIKKIVDFLSIKGTNNEKLTALENLKLENELFNTGLEELKSVIEKVISFGLDESFYIIDLTIARGLDYYTGTVYETILDDYPSLGSVCSGGRYDNLTCYYTEKSLKGVGISIGLTRLFYQLKEAGIIKSNKKTLSKVLVVPFAKENMNYALKVSTSLRDKNIICDVYYEEKGLKQKLKYANRLGIPYVCIIGEDEEKEEKVTLKNMETGEQNKVTIDEMINILK